MAEGKSSGSFDYAPLDFRRQKVIEALRSRLQRGRASWGWQATVGKVGLGGRIHVRWHFLLTIP